jgi:hypothetical protein
VSNPTLDTGAHQFPNSDTGAHRPPTHDGPPARRRELHANALPPLDAAPRSLASPSHPTGGQFQHPQVADDMDHD